MNKKQLNKLYEKGEEKRVKNTGIPKLPKNYRFRFGKYKGEIAREVPLSYRQWFQEFIPKSE